MNKLKTMPVTVWAVPLLFFLYACEDEAENGTGGGNNDTLFTGLSGVIILAIVVWLIWRALKKRNGGDGAP